MRAMLVRILDGAATGLSLSLLAGVLALLRGTPIDRFSGWLFYAGGATILLAALWGLVSPGETRGLLGWLGLRSSAAAPEVAAAPLRSIWVDRFATTRNIWLTAGITMIGLSFVLLLLGS
ncbi:MAG: hypothetical protein H6648_05845 [Caldilineae bacterium]|nr:hypothetical protein [Chloroflexota bacterium]MCB9176667.1 hypothetical protein [Caldilineae bacterium]